MKKDKIIACRLNYKEYDNFSAKCTENNIAMSEVLRATVLNYIKDYVPKYKHKKKQLQNDIYEIGVARICHDLDYDKSKIKNFFQTIHNTETFKYHWYKIKTKKPLKKLVDDIISEKKYT